MRPLFSVGSITIFLSSSGAVILSVHDVVDLRLRVSRFCEDSRSSLRAVAHATSPGAAPANSRRISKSTIANCDSDHGSDKKCRSAVDLASPAFYVMHATVTKTNWKCSQSTTTMANRYKPLRKERVMTCSLTCSLPIPRKSPAKQGRSHTHMQPQFNVLQSP